MSNARNISKADSRFVNATGDTISGTLNPTSDLHVGTNAEETLFFGARGCLLSSDTHITHNIYWDTDWTIIDSTMPSSSIRLGGAGNEIKISQAPAGSTTLTDRLVIDNAGRVTTPNQPFGYAVGTTSSTGSYSTYHVVDWLAASTLQGGMAFSNGGRFTVPVAGTYMVTMSLYSYENSGDTEHIAINLHKNGTQYAPFQWETDGSGHAGRVDLSLSTTWLVTCAANDYLELRLYCDAGQTMDFFKGVGNNYFGVYLLG